MTIETRPGVRADGQPYHNFKTLDVFRDGEMIGAIQCVGPCYGVTADPRHKHGPWIAFAGAQTLNLPGRHATQDDAIRTVVQAS